MGSVRTVDGRNEDHRERDGDHAGETHKWVGRSQARGRENRACDYDLARPMRGRQSGRRTRGFSDRDPRGAPVIEPREMRRPQCLIRGRGDRSPGRPSAESASPLHGDERRDRGHEQHARPPERILRLDPRDGRGETGDLREGCGEGVSTPEHRVPHRAEGGGRERKASYRECQHGSRTDANLPRTRDLSARPLLNSRASLSTSACGSRQNKESERVDVSDDVAVST